MTIQRKYGSYYIRDATSRYIQNTYVIFYIYYV